MCSTTARCSVFGLDATIRALFWTFMTECQEKTCKIFHNIPKSVTSMQPEERQHRISEYLQKVEFAALEEIAKKVEASVSTVRRDLSVLAASGSVVLPHGGGSSV